MNKYIVANLKDSLTDKTFKEYIDIISDIDYDNLIICPSYKYLKQFKNINCFLGMQDYYDDTICDYVIIGHYEKNNSVDEINDKIKKAENKNIKIILCVGNDSSDDLNSLKKKVDSYKINSDIIIAYEPNYMINSKKNVDIKMVDKTIKFLKENYNYKVLYGGNVNESNINDLLSICDGVLIGRSSFNPHKFTKLIKKNI